MLHLSDISDSKYHGEFKLIKAMLSGFIKFILSIFIFLLAITSLFLFFIKFIVLNQGFYTYSLQRKDTYKNLTRAIQRASKEMLINQIASSSNDYNKMTLGERADIEAQVDSFISFINEQSVSTFIDVNIKNILLYLNNKSGDLILYLPINEWGLPQEMLKSIPDYLQKTNINVKEIIINQKGTEGDLATLNNLRHLSKYVSLGLIAGIALQIFLILIYALLNKSGDRYHAIGKLFSFQGIFILIISWIGITAHNIFSEGLTYKTGWSEVLAGTLVPIFVKPLVITFTVYGLFVLIIGILLFNKESKNQLVNKAKVG